MNRREVLTLLGGAAVGVGPRSAWGQQGQRVRRIGVLMGAAPASLGQAYVSTFAGRLAELGWLTNRNAQIEVRWWNDDPAQMRNLVVQLVASSPDVIMVFSNLALEVLRPLTGSTPIVFVGVGDPVGAGFVSSIARPGGSVTGFSGTDGPIGGKWFEIIKETAPHLKRVLAILHPETPVHQAFWQSLREAALNVGVEPVFGGVHDSAEITAVVSSFSNNGSGGMIVFPHAITWANESLLIALGLQHKIPTHYATAASIKAGGLVSYGHDFEDSFRKTAEYVDRILRGEKPGDLPVQQPVKFKLVFNLRTALSLGLTVPPTLLARADEVIE